MARENDRKALLGEAAAAEAGGRWLDAARLYAASNDHYQAAVCYQKGRALPECLDELLKVSRASPSYRSACVNATRVAGLLGQPLSKLAPLVGLFLELPPGSAAEATALKELAPTRPTAEAVQIYRRVLAAFPDDAEAREAIKTQRAMVDTGAFAAFKGAEQATPVPRASAPTLSRQGQRFTEILVAQGRLTRERLSRVIAAQPAYQHDELALGEALVGDGTVSELDVVKALSESTGTPFISCARLLATALPDAAKVLPREKAERWGVCPIAVISRQLYVAMRDPRDLRLLDQLRFASGHPAKGVFATENAIRRGIRQQYHREKVEDDGSEDWRSWDHMPQVPVSRFSDGEQEFDTQELLMRATGEPGPLEAPRPPGPPVVAAAPPTSRPPAADAPLPLLRPLEVGQVVAARYRLDALIGQGGTATVFRAHDLELEEAVALKVFAPSAKAGEQIQRYKSELSLSRQLNHKNIIRLFDLGSHEGWRYLSMELLEGADVATLLQDRRGPLELAGGLEILEQACAGLQHAHSAGVVHRDVKPGNLFVTRQGVVKLMDFGLAKRGASHITQEGVAAGTPDYMSPEQIAGFSTVTHLTDLYALGCTAYDVFTGAPPFTGEVMTVLMQQVNNVPPPLDTKNPQVPPALTALVARLLEKDPARRVQSAAEVGAELQRIRSNLSRPLTTQVSSGRR